MNSMPKAFQGDYIPSLLDKHQMSVLAPYLQATQRSVLQLERGQHGSQQMGVSRIAVILIYLRISSGLAPKVDNI